VREKETKRGKRETQRGKDRERERESNRSIELCLRVREDNAAPSFHLVRAMTVCFTYTALLNANYQMTKLLAKNIIEAH
jgi:hypothetical protein